MTKETCERCKQIVDTDKDFFVTLGTHKKQKTIEMAYFHFNCWRSHFEERARLKAEAVINGMQERMKPIASGLIDKLKGAIGSGEDQVVTLD